MAPMKMSWHKEGGRLASAWLESASNRVVQPSVDAVFIPSRSQHTETHPQPILSIVAIREHPVSRAPVETSHHEPDLLTPA